MARSTRAGSSPGAQPPPRRRRAKTGLGRFRPGSRAGDAAGEAVQQRAVEWIDANACRNVGAEELAAHLGVSRRLVDLRFREILGRSIYEVIRDRRLEEAKRLLRHTGESIAEITARCGFENKTHLKNLFRRRVGCSMRQWRTGVGASEGR